MNFAPAANMDKTVDSKNPAVITHASANINVDYSIVKNNNNNFDGI